MAKTTKITKESTATKETRRLKLGRYQRGKFQKRIKYAGPSLPPATKLFRHSLGIIRRNKKIFGLILFAYIGLSILLVRGFSSTAQLTSVKATITATKGTGFATSTSILSSLFSASSATTTGGTTFQLVLFIIMSLVIIWALRQVHGKQNVKVSIKDAFYKSTEQLIPFTLVLLVVSLQLIPMLIGASLYSMVVVNGLAVNGLEKLPWMGVFFLLALSSLYALSSSIFALYIVTLSGVTPLQALRSAKELVRLRRWTVMRKILFLPVFLFTVICLIMLPTVLWLTPIAEWIYFAIGLGTLIIAHSYLYNLYRELM